MTSKGRFYFGNAKADDVRGSGWFVGQFVPAELGPRRQTEVELKWGIHPRGEKRSHPWANQNGTTISVLVEGSLRITFHIDGTEEEVVLRTKGDYVIFGPDVVHAWEAVSDAIVLSVRFPSVEVGSRAAPIAGTRRRSKTQRTDEAELLARSGVRVRGNTQAPGRILPAQARSGRQ